MAETGPQYPPGQQPGSNGIGLFSIGVSPIGEIASFDVWRTIISQYANSPILTRLIENIFEYLDQTKNMSDFFDFVWNVDTAQGYGLDVWGRIVGVSRVVQVEVGSWFGYEEALPGSFTFSQGSFYSGDPLTSNFRLTDQAYRQLILTKAATNITGGSIAAINRILMTLFPNRGNAYVIEGTVVAGGWFGFMESTTATGFNQASFYAGASIPSMTMTYVFEFPLSPVELAIVQQSGVLPKSTGVASHILVT